MRAKEAIDFSLYVFGALIVAFSSGFAQHGISAEGFGFTLGTLVIPTIIAYAVHGRIGKRPYNQLGFARWLWWSTLVLTIISTASHKRQHMSTADVQEVLEQAANLTPDNAIDNSGKSPELIEEETRYRALIRSYFKEIVDARSEFDRRRAAIDAKLDGIYQPKSYTPNRAKQIIAALNENIALNNDIRTWTNGLVLSFRTRVKQSGLTASEQQSTLRAFQDSVSGSPLWPTLKSFLAADTELDQVSIQFYAAIIKGNNDEANSYLDRLQELGNKDTELSAQVSKLQAAGLKKSGFNGTERVFHKTSAQ
jgi:hypothetical protein